MRGPSKHLSALLRLAGTLAPTAAATARGQDPAPPPTPAAAGLDQRLGGYDATTAVTGDAP